jgi:hypothetical protein
MVGSDAHINVNVLSTGSFPPILMRKPDRGYAHPLLAGAGPTLEIYMDLLEQPMNAVNNVTCLDSL